MTDPQSPLDPAQRAVAKKSPPATSATVSQMQASIETSQIGGAQSPAASSKSAETPIPQTFGRYKIDKELGKGAMGVVYLAEDTQLGRKVALKIPKKAMLEDPETLERFYREAKTTATLRHNNICPVYDVGAIDGTHYLTMAYIPGKPVSSFLAKGKVPAPKQTALLIRKIALALGEAHKQGVIHRDLKPSNVMLDDRGEPIVMDFGLARNTNTTENARLTQSGAIMGTPAYMSPEQVRGETDQIGPASDIYALGVMMYQLLTGELPFSGPIMLVFAQIVTQQPKRPSEVKPGVDPSLEAICLKMMAKEIDQRYASMKDAAAALTEYLKAGSVTGLEAVSPSPVTTPPGASAEPTSPISSVPGFNFDALAAFAGGDADSSLIASRKKAKQPSKVLATVSSRRRSNGSFWLIGALLGFALTGLFAVIYVQFGGAKVTIEIDDPTAVVKVDGRVVTINGVGTGNIRLSIGPHEYTVEKDNVVVRTAQSFQVTKDGRNVVTITLEEPQPPGQQRKPERGSSAVDKPLESATVPPSPKSDDAEIADFIKNPTFADGLDGWNPEAGAKSFRKFSLKNGQPALTTFGDKGDKNTGRIYQQFRVPANATDLEFLVHGGVHKPLHVSLREGEQTRHTARGHNRNEPMTKVSWNLRELRGKAVTLEIVDQQTASPWGYIGVSGFRIVTDAPDQSSDSPEASVPSADAPSLAVAPFNAAQAKAHQKAWAKYLGVPMEFTSSIGMKFRLIPPGEFLMGAPESEAGRKKDELEHRIKISKPFRLGTYEVTQAEYELIMGRNPSKFSQVGKGKEHISGDDPLSSFPVETVSWFDAVEFCNRLSSRDGQPAYYRIENVNWKDGSVNSADIEIAGGIGYRLPTEAEMEYACRAGTTTAFHFGDVNSGRDANINGSGPDGKSTMGIFLRRPTNVGSYKANNFGLHDLHGNVQEWCGDWYSASFYEQRIGTVSDPFNIAIAKTRVLRGGSWSDKEGSTRSANRDGWYAPDYRANDTGFRVAQDLTTRTTVSQPTFSVTTPAVGKPPAEKIDGITYSINGGEPMRWSFAKSSGHNQGPDRNGVWSVGSASMDPADHKKFNAAVTGQELFCEKISNDIYTQQQFSDVRVELEFMIPQGSNSGVFLMGEYEININDTDRSGHILRGPDPIAAARKPAGEWQSFDITFRAPQFNAAGQKTADAKFEKVIYNGVRIYTEVVLKEPTADPSLLTGKESATGPLLLQGSIGPVAYRNIRITPLSSPKIALALPADAKIFNGHAYKFFPEQLPWQEAKARCANLGGQLIVIDNAEENTFAASLIEGAGRKDSWIGVTDELKEGEWITPLGQPASFAYWYKGQPNNNPPGEHYALMSNRQFGKEFMGWRWCDQPNIALSPHEPGFLCEWETSPQQK